MDYKEVQIPVRGLLSIRKMGSTKEIIKGVIEILIVLLFASSAIIMSMSQEKIMKSTDVTLTNIENFEVALLAQQNAVQSSLHHLISCNALDLTKYVKETPTHEFLEMVEQAKKECVSDSLERVVNATKTAENLIDVSIQYKNITNNDFEIYRDKSEVLSKWGFYTFYAGIILSIGLILFIISPIIKRKLNFTTSNM